MHWKASNPPARVPSFFARLVREPLVHFLLIGLALFLVASGKSAPAPGGDAARRIILTDDDLRQLAGLWRAQWNRDPTPQELRRLVDDQIREEVAFREAMAAGLDRQDILVRRRLVDRMNYLWETQGDFADPSDDDLRRWYAAHAGQFAPPREASFATLYFSDRTRGGKAKEEAILARDALSGKGADAAENAGQGDPSDLPPSVEAMSPDEVAGLYGQELATALGGLPLGVWAGPVAVPGGYDLVFLSARTPGDPPPFETIRTEVRDAWRKEQREKARKEALAAARARYTVELPANLGGNAP